MSFSVQDAHGVREFVLEAVRRGAYVVPLGADLGVIPAPPAPKLELARDVGARRDKCLRCGDPVPADKTNRATYRGYCGWSCERREPAPRTRPCAHCGRDFTRSRRKGQVKFCGSDCVDAARFDHECGRLRARTCRICGIEYHIRSDSNPQKTCREPACVLEYSRRHVSTNLNIRADRLYNNARATAAAKGLAFNLDQELWRERMRAGRCEVTGVKFDFSRRKDRPQHIAPFAPSIDRIVGAKGYTEGNVQLVTWAYNACKATGTHADVVALAYAVIAMEEGRVPRPVSVAEDPFLLMEEDYVSLVVDE